MVFAVRFRIGFASKFEKVSFDDVSFTNQVRSWSGRILVIPGAGGTPLRARGVHLLDPPSRAALCRHA
jgi:hypothetical protein